MGEEYEECKIFYQIACYSPRVRQYLIKNVNEGKRTRFMGYMLNLIGMRKGLPDYQLPLRNDKYIGLWIEMKKKSEKDKPKKFEQVDWLAKLRVAGHYASFAYGHEEAIQILNDYLNNQL
jgi:hypothetical protein